MINKELNDIMNEYIAKAKRFCNDYEKKVIEKGCSDFSHSVEVVFENFEHGLWKLKSDTESLMYISHDKFCNREANKGTLDIIDLANTEFESVHNDLNTMHNYYMCKYKSNIAKGLAKQWSEEADRHAFEMMKRAVKYMIKAGVENDN